MTDAPPTDWNSAWQRFLAFSMAQYGLSSADQAVDTLKRQLEGLEERIQHDMPDDVAVPVIACIRRACEHLSENRGPDAFGELNQLTSRFGLDPSALGVRGPRR